MLLRAALTCLGVLTPLIAALAQPAPVREGLYTVEDQFKQHCGVCHGERMQGSAQGTALVGTDLQHGADIHAITRSIAKGFPDAGMPSWEDVLTEDEIKSLALWITEHRDGLLYADFNFATEIVLPKAAVASEEHSFLLTSVATGLDPLPYSMTLLPNGDLIVSEKMRGLRIVSADGTVSDIVTGTPRVYDDVRNSRPGLKYGQGWLLEVAAHPNYADNGWIYLHYTDRCEDCNAMSREHNRPVSMNALMRGRIREGRWVDQEILWKAPIEDYTISSDVAAGGRITFDPDGFVFISTGMKTRERIQDLSSSHGKILRLHEDGRIPTDNPYVDHPTAYKLIWTVGHRSPQGLEFHVPTRTLWGTEHGPRGGDEVNLLSPGKNYGWPLYSNGQNYNGTEVAWGRDEYEIERKDTVEPIVDMTPSPAISSFVIYDGSAFSRWDGDFIVGSLKASDVFRLRIEDKQLVHQERLIEDLARIRDIEVDQQGLIYLLLEHDSGGQIVRLEPAQLAAARR